MINKKPLYNLNAVLREVNITPDVLRAWERRYQLPVPHRTAGGHRLYSDYDVEIIKWLKARQEEGLSISRAVNLWRELSATGDPLASVREVGKLTTETNRAPSGAIDTFREKWIHACLAYDTESAESILNQALSLFSIENVCIRIIQQGLSNIGEKWLEGSASVQQEHFASALAQNRIQAIIAGTPGPLFDKTVIIGCPPGELHTFPGLLLTLLIRREGFKVVYLGADIPMEQLAETANSINPHLIILTAQRLPAAMSLAAAAAVLQSHHQHVGFGGLVFTRAPQLTGRIAGHYLGDSIEGSISHIKELVINPRPIILPDSISEEQQHLFNEFNEHRGLIEHQVLHAMRDNLSEIPNLQEINGFMGDSIAAAIALGDLHFMDQDIAWVKKLNRRVDVNANIYPLYMTAYQQAIQKELGTIALPINSWFSNAFINNRNEEF